MKEFELKYKSALGSATTMYACAKESNNKEMIQALELIFPELKKTKDELIKEELIHFLETCRDPRFVGSRKQDEWIEWLEKQQTTNSESDWNEEDETTFACLIGTLTWTANNNYHCSEDILKYTHWLENLKQRLNGCK